MKSLMLFAAMMALLGCCAQSDVTEEADGFTGGDQDEHGCFPSAGFGWCEAKQKCVRQWEEPCEGRLHLDDAKRIASDSSCREIGNFTNEAFYNNFTDTWWIGLDAEKPGCNPACVVFEDNESAEVNWRCTGLVQG